MTTTEKSTATIKRNEPLLAGSLNNGEVVQEGGRIQAIICNKERFTPSVFYIFLTHLSLLTNRAVEPCHMCPFKAPFLVYGLTKRVKCIPATLIKNGVTHYGYQIIPVERTFIRLCITLTTQVLPEHLGWLTAYESLRFSLFSNSGLMNPTSHFDIIVKYESPSLHKKTLSPFQRYKLGKPSGLEAPLPYHQSPIPHPHYIDFEPIPAHGLNPHKAITPTLASIANKETILVANFLPTEKRFKAWLPLNVIQRDQLPNFTTNTLTEVTQNFAPYSFYSRKLREIFSLPSFKPTHYNQSSQTICTDEPMPLNLTLTPQYLKSKNTQGTQTDGLILLSFYPKSETYNNLDAQTEDISDSIDQV
jgi:hypothetical protein